MSNENIKVGLIGSGFAAKFHFEALKRVYSTKLTIVGVYARNVERLNRFADECGIAAIYDIQQLINQCDVLHICTPPVTHEDLVIQVLSQNKYAIVEKPFTGYFGDGSETFNGDTFDRKMGYEQAILSIKRMIDAESKSAGKMMYDENWVYAPAIQKARELIEKTSAQVLWIQAQQSHSGSHSPDYGKWKLSGGGSLMGKGAHPLSAAIYLKHVEGIARTGKPIHPKTITARVHAITRMESYINQKHLRDSYTDIEDYANVHVVFDDGTIADIVASELLHGGVKNYLEVHANNHRTICNIAPNNAMQTYNPVDDNFKDIYVVEKTGTKQGWSNISPDEAWFNGYQHEMEAFYHSVVFNTPIQSNSALAADVIATIYAAYLSAEKNGAEVPIIGFR